MISCIISARVARRACIASKLSSILAIALGFCAVSDVANAQSSLGGSRKADARSGETRLGTIPRYHEVYIDGAVEYNPVTCAQVDTGSWAVDVQPTYGTLSLRTRSGTLASGACPGVNFTFAAIYYTWTEHSNKSKTDSLKATYNSQSFHVPFSYSVTVPVVVPNTETTQAKGWDARGMGVWAQQLGNSSDPNFDWSSDRVLEIDPKTGSAKDDTCWCKGSAIPPQFKLSGGQWALQANGAWAGYRGNDEFDHVGWCAVAGQCASFAGLTPVGYYRKKQRAPCGTHFSQQMQFLPKATMRWANYGPVNKLVLSFTDTTVTSSRAGKSQTHRFSPQKVRPRIACKLFKAPSLQLVAGKSASFTDPRPVAAALDELEQSFGVRTTYEDPPFSYRAHLTSMVQTADDDSTLLIPKEETLRFAPSTRASADAMSLAQEVVTAYNAAGKVATFAVRQGRVPHVVPDQVANDAGHLTRITPVLDTHITLERKSRTLFELLGEITGEVSKQTGQRIGAGAVPTGLMREKVLIGADNRAARDVLDDALFSGGQKVSWRLLYDPGLKAYFLNISVL